MADDRHVPPPPPMHTPCSSSIPDALCAVTAATATTTTTPNSRRRRTRLSTHKHYSRRRRHRHSGSGGGSHLLDPGLADYNATHRNILRNSRFNLEYAAGAKGDHDDDGVVSPPPEPVNAEAISDSPAHQNSSSSCTSSRGSSPQRDSIVIRRPVRRRLLDEPNKWEYNSEAYCHRASLSSVETYPPRQRRKEAHSSEDSHRTVPRRRLPAKRRGILSQGISPVIEGSSLGSSRNSPLPSLDASPDKGASEVKKMYLETKINMLEIIQSGLQLKLDMQCVREQFLSLLETYTYMEDTYLCRPRHSAAAQPLASSSDKPVSAGRARVRALYDARRARIKARRDRFNKEMAAATGQGMTPLSSKPKAVAGGLTSSDGLSDATSFDDWELKSVSSGDVLDARDCSHHRHNNSPSSEGVMLTNSSPESEIPLGGAANSSSCGANTTSSSDGTSMITKLAEKVSVVDKENLKPEQNNNVINSSMSDSHSQHSHGSGNSRAGKLATINEENNANHRNNANVLRNSNNQTQDTISDSVHIQSAPNVSEFEFPNNSDLHSYCSQDVDVDMDMDENGYVVMRGIDPSIMDYNVSSCMGGGAGEALQSRISGFSDLSHEIPRTCQNSYNIPLSPLRDTSIPIYTARNSRDVEGEYVMLKSPFSDIIGDYVTLKEPPLPDNSLMSFYEMNMEPSMLLKPETTTLPWTTTTSFNVTGNFGPSNIITNSQLIPPPVAVPNRKESPVKYATSELIKKLYTKDRSLRDISNISRISRVGLNDTTNIANSTVGCSMLGSPESSSASSYPLNSTMKMCAADNTNVMMLATNVDDSDDTLENIGDEMLEVPYPHRSFDTRTSFSEPSAVPHAPNASRRSMSSPKSMDDSFFLDNYEPEPQEPMYDSQDFVTPKRKMPKKPQLCKEHGLHPTFGGPCIFEDSFDVMDSSTEEDEVSSSQQTDRSKAKSRQSQASSSYTAGTETDCDSSYLSECVDDTHFTNDFGNSEDADQYMYDARNARMKMLRRQTGQTDIQHCKAPVGLSETDLHFNVTRKHLSLEATRTSLPDLANLSVPPSECSEDQDTTLKLTDNSVPVDSSMSSSVFSKPIQDRPLSISTIATTTTDESPESNGGIHVPVNSPNVTDSGSSRPTTDNYDYVDIPRDIIPKHVSSSMPPPRMIPPRRRQAGVGSSASPSSTRPYTTYGSSTGSSSRIAPTSSRPIGGSLHSIHQQHHHKSHSSLHHKSQHSLHDQSFHHHQQQQQQPQQRRSRRPSGHRSEGVSSGEHYGYSSSSTKRYPRSTDSGVVTHHRIKYDLEDEQTTRRRAYTAEQNANVQTITRERKKVLAKKLKQFSNNFYNSTGNLQIKTLGHF